jgi:hypothetical protein
MTSTAARSAATVARRATDCGRDSRMARRAPCTHRAVGRPRSGAQRCIALLCAVCVATALTDHGCQRLLPWTASPNALKTFVPSISNRTDKSLAYASHYMYHSKLARMALDLCRANSAPELRILEIGLGCRMPRGPGGSVALWLAMFPPPITLQLHVLELDSSCVQKWRDDFRAHASRVSCHIGDQNSTDDLDRVYRSAGAQPFHMVVDDGSHFSAHQRNTLWHMVTSDYVRPGGLYVIEDIRASSCVDYVANDPRNPTTCTRYGCHNRIGKGAGKTGGTRGCLLLTDGAPTFLATLQEWQVELVGGNNLPVKGRVRHIDVYEQAAVVHIEHDGSLPFY